MIGEARSTLSYFFKRHYISLAELKGSVNQFFHSRYRTRRYQIATINDYDLEAVPLKVPTTTVTTTLPVVKRRCVIADTIAIATSSGSATRLSGVVAAWRSTPSRPRPGTKSAATAAGETPMTRTSGASTRASDTPIVSRAAFEAQ